jgi:hypothetical protein
MKICFHCGAMISPHPMHRDISGVCADCHNEALSMVASAMGMKEVPEHLLAKDDIDNGRPKMRGKHMIMRKSSEQKAIEDRQKNRRFARY